MSRVCLDVSGMTCAACSARVEKVLSRVDGVAQARVNLPLQRAVVDAPGDMDATRLIEAIRKAGYDARLRANDETSRRRADESRDAERRAFERQTLLRVALGAVFSTALVIGTMPAMLGASEAWISGHAQWLLATLTMAATGLPFFREAAKALAGGTANMAVLVAIGTGAAYLYSAALVIADAAHGHLFFEAAAVVATLVMLGRYLEARSKTATTSALSALARLRPREAERMTAGGGEAVPVEELLAGDRVLVRPGARIPADGRIVAGQSEIDESLVTGESNPVLRGPGERVLTGTVNGLGSMEIEVTAIGEDTRLSRIARLVEDAQVAEAPIQKLVDRISAVFVPAILLIALATFAAWMLLSGDFSVAIAASVAVLVIACPCALGLATPTALVAGTGAAARAGILIRDIATLEKAAQISTVAFDKTGTLTEGRPAVVRVATVSGDDKNMLAIAGAVEARSEHPLAAALLSYLRELGIALEEAVDIRAVAGQGVVGTVGRRRVAVGNLRLMDAECVNTIATEELTNALAATSGSLAFVAIDGVVAGAILFTDRLRPEAVIALKGLRRDGKAIVMLTGDNSATARSIAFETGIDDFRAGLAPEDKLRAIRDLSTDGASVAFVGDGVNDGPALAAAGLGIAMSSGAEVAREAAGITLMRPDLRLVPASLDIASHTNRTIRQNLGWAFIYNAVGIPLAAFGVLPPVFAGAAMAFSSVSVVANSMRLSRWRPRFDDINAASGS